MYNVSGAIDYGHITSCGYINQYFTCVKKMYVLHLWHGMLQEKHHVTSTGR
jgi:hypothetical protein